MTNGSPALGHDEIEFQLIAGDSFNSIISQYLCTTGDGLGVVDLTGNAAPYFIQPPPLVTDRDFEYLIDELRMVIADSRGPSAYNTFGSIGALANGIRLYFIRNDAGVLYTTKTFFEDVVNYAQLLDNGESQFSLLETTLFIKIKYPTPIRLKKGDSLVLQTMDDMAGVVEYMRVRAIGRSYMG
jgi:hypothetical protein